MSDAKLGASTAKAPEPSATTQAPNQPERRGFEALLQRLSQEAQAQGQENPVIAVQAGRPFIYKGVPGQDQVSENIPIEAIQKVLRAVEEPESLNGTVKLSVNGEVALYNQKGEVSQDAFGLTSQGQQIQEAQASPEIGAPSLQAAAQGQSSSQQQPVEPQKQPEAAQPPNLETAAELEGLKTQISQLESLVAKQQRQIHLLEQRTNLIASAPILNVNNKLGNWLEDIRGKVGNTLQQTSQQLSSRVQKDTALLDSYRAKAQELVKATQARIGEVKQTAKEFVGTAQTRLEEAKQVTTSAVQATQAKLGEVKQVAAETLQTVQATGTQVSKAYDQAVDRHYAAHAALGQVVAGAARNAATAAVEAKAMWDHYSAQSNSKGPFQTAAAVARNAIRDKLPDSQIRQILSANPSMNQFGEKGRRELVEQPLEKAKREVALSQQSAQQAQQQGKESSLSR